MIIVNSFLLLLAVTSRVGCQRNIPRSARASRNEAALEFECPEEFGYYPHPRDCTQYYVCVFGGALLESCTGGLMYSHELQTCDWPRNVGCPGGGSASKESEEDPLFERSAKIESLQDQQHQHQHQQQQAPLQRSQPQPRREQHHQQRPVQRQPIPITTTPTPIPQITEKQIRQRQQARNYHEDEYEPASEIESDRQQRVYRGQPSTIGQVQRDRDGLRRNVIAEREKESTRAQTEAHYRTQVPSSESPRVAKILASTVSSKTYYDSDQSYPYFTIYEDDVPSIFKDEDYNQYTVNQSVPVQPSVKVSDVNQRQYQKPKKVAVNEADKYNLNHDDNVQDYDIYENQAQVNKNKFRINEGQSFRPNVLNHPGVHVTTPNAIVDTFIPLTTTTQPPPSTTNRPYTVNAPVSSRGRPQQIHRGTAPPRSRPTLKPSTEFVPKAQEFVDIYRHPPTRPSPIYPTPQVDKPAAKCRKDVCLLPDCSCGGIDIPGGIPAEQTPQIVLLTFDDAVNDLNKQLYADLFENGRKNPNGCPIAATFYVSHEWTDYSQVQNLYADGHEMASHTVSHSFGEQFSQRKWSREVAGQREILSAYGGVKLEDVRGMRAPFLSVGGNNMFKMLWDTNFTYDSSMPIYENRPPSWPYTLDYKLFHDCMIPPCPTRSYPGLWEVPMVMWQDLNGGRCSMGDACSNPPTADGVYKMLIKNFERHYTTNRSPFGLFYHAAWFTQPHHKEGFISFLDTIVAMDDVWIVTNWQAIQWVRNPTPLPLMHTFEPFGCNYQGRPKKCNNPRVCNLWHKSGVRYMKTCQACPDIYPWTGKTGIRSSRIDNDVDSHE
ncbi:chitin deacetylase-like 5 isoform X2 [Lasioglossum baleicum]|uniref:chitin deacetylase-like 5 isoform X2 n=1 Tax=Lasioglossum baleicum TaxID=434251 RepID=UPI003FCEA57A